jgi:hypothetical protein
MTVLRYVIDAGVLLLALVGVVELCVFIAAPFITSTEFEWDEDDERLM